MVVIKVTTNIEGQVGRCSIQKHRNGGWHPVLNPDVRQWCDALGIWPTGRVSSYRFASYEFATKREARLFTLVWL